MDEYVAIYERIASLGFPAVLFLALVGSYFDVWRWGRQCRDAAVCAEERADLRLQEWKERCQQAELRAADWQTMTLRATGLVETSVTSIAKRVG